MTVHLSYAQPLTLDELQEIALDETKIALAPDARARIGMGRAVLINALEQGTRVYGLNTGLGHTRDVDVPTEVLDQYQVDIVTSHASAVGEPLPDPEVRAIMAARLAGACRGYSGLSTTVAEFYAAMLNAGVVPSVPREGSIGAADLGTLAAVASTMIGRGTARLNGETLPSTVALERAGLEPVRLGLKEGLAVVSENSYSIGVGALALGDMARTLRLADVAAAMTMEAARSSLSPFDPEVAIARPFRGQAEVAARILRLLDGSYLLDPAAASSLQDPLSIRTVAQVHGAARAVFQHLAEVVETELNASDDNPMTSPDTGRALSTGNFHPMELALGFESIRVALAHLALVCERRIGVIGMELWSARKATDEATLPADAILTRGLAGYAHAAISARIKTLANPVTIHIPSLDHGQEDHATAAPLAVDLAREVSDRLNAMLAGEIIVAATLLSWRPDVALGAGTRPYFDAVVQAAREGGPDELGADLVARATPRLLALTPRRIDLDDESLAAIPLFGARERKAASHEEHEDVG
ncbi:histidine ammonia-lyase [Microlunatus sp. GCM10028923]|uniref:HAL/PAL/TAL family ammonia-lyase n=1 Tax=Microlunatus sp. GCM10028923 TaxID=3273400 RepID=UPI0036095BBD